MRKKTNKKEIKYDEYGIPIKEIDNRKQDLSVLSFKLMANVIPRIIFLVISIMLIKSGLSQIYKSVFQYSAETADLWKSGEIGVFIGLILLSIVPSLSVTSIASSHDNNEGVNTYSIMIVFHFIFSFFLSMITPNIASPFTLSGRIVMSLLIFYMFLATIVMRIIVSKKIIVSKIICNEVASEKIKVYFCDCEWNNKIEKKFELNPLKKYSIRFFHYDNNANKIEFLYRKKISKKEYDYLKEKNYHTAKKYKKYIILDKIKIEEKSTKTRKDKKLDNEEKCGVARLVNFSYKTTKRNIEIYAHVEYEGREEKIYIPEYNYYKQLKKFIDSDIPIIFYFDDVPDIKYYEIGIFDE